METAIHVFNGLRRHLPLLTGLAANSPWWFGRDSGLASARWALVRSYPGRGIPPAFESWDAYLEHMAQLGPRAAPPDYTLVWWDVRPHPRLGTVEVRELDAQASLDDVAAITALTQALARREAEAPATRAAARRGDRLGLLPRGARRARRRDPARRPADAAARGRPRRCIGARRPGGRGAARARRRRGSAPRSARARRMPEVLRELVQETRPG